MTKTELVQSLAERTGMGKGQAGHTLDVILDIIGDELAAGRKVTLTGFGTFSVSRREGRDARNPATGDTIHVPERNVPKFKAGAVLKANIR